MSKPDEPAAPRVEPMSAKQFWENWVPISETECLFRKVGNTKVLQLMFKFAEAYARTVSEQAEPDNQELMQLLEYCRTILADGMTAVRKAVHSREWLTEGRGPYQWNDDNWHKEFAAAAKEILDAVEPFEKEAADWSNCPKTAAEVAESRRNLKAVLARVTKEREALESKLELLNSFYACNADEDENTKLSEATRQMVNAQQEAEAFKADNLKLYEECEQAERERDQVRDALRRGMPYIRCGHSDPELTCKRCRLENEADEILARKSKPTSHGSPEENGGTQPSASLLREKEIDHEPAPVKGEYSPEQGAEPGKEKA